VTDALGARTTMPRTVTVNWIDWITLAIVLVSILRGTRYGVLAGLVDLAAMVGAFLTASVLYLRAVPPLHQTLFLPTSWAGFTAFTAIWLGLYVAVGLVVRLVHGVRTMPLSEMLGGAIGIVRGFALTTALLVIMLAAPFRAAIETDATRSTVAPFLLKGYAGVMGAIVPAMPVRIPRVGPGGTPF
jgi:uncharacterized membrane protein required for colicin V production